MAIGFLGFGEAGSHIARGLSGAGARSLAAFDIRSGDADTGARIRTRAVETGTTLVDTPAALAAHASLIFSVVTADSAAQAADGIAEALRPHHFFVDLNSVSPATKVRIAAAISGGAGRFVEGAIMAPVPGSDHRVPILLNGPWADSLVRTLKPFHMCFDVMDGSVGAAAAVKMCRSIMMKGMEALVLECALAAGRYGATDRVFASLTETYPGMDWKKTSDYMIGRVLAHGERRAREMEEVVRTLEAVGVEPLMAQAIVERQDWEATARRAGRLRERPSTLSELLNLLSADSARS